MTYTRTITVEPAFNKRHPEPRKNYGIHGCELVFTVVNEEKTLAANWAVMTHWQLPHVAAELAQRSEEPRFKLDKPTPAALHYHKPTAGYEGQPQSDSCHLLAAGKCFSDSRFVTEWLFDILLEKGSNGVFEAMEAWLEDRK